MSSGSAVIRPPTAPTFAPTSLAVNRWAAKHLRLRSTVKQQVLIGLSIVDKEVKPKTSECTARKADAERISCRVHGPGWP